MPSRFDFVPGRDTATRDWSRAAMDELLFLPDRSPVPSYSAAKSAVRELPSFHLGLAGRCLLAGAMMTLLYVWPVEMIVSLITGGLRDGVFALVLATGFAIATIGSWVITLLEERRWVHDWDKNWHKLSDFADPPHWR